MNVGVDFQQIYAECAMYESYEFLHSYSSSMPLVNVEFQE